MFTDQLLRTGGLIYIANNYNVDTDTLPKPTTTNLNTSIASIESTYTFDRIAHFQDFNSSHAQEDEQNTQYDDCDLPSSITSRLTPSFNLTLFGVNNLELMARIFPAVLQNVASVLVSGAIQTFLAGSSYSNFYAIANQNGDGSPIAITSLIEATTLYPLVLNTDYRVITSNGVYGIEFINSGNYNLTTNNITLTYDYTPSEATILGYRSEAQQKPFNLFKFVSCEDTFEEAGVLYEKQNRLYINRAFLNSEYTENFVNLSRGELTGADLTFTVDKGGNYYHKKAVVPA